MSFSWIGLKETNKAKQDSWKQFKTEEKRNRTFVYGQKQGSRSPNELAKAGFEHMPGENDPDRLYCALCGVEGHEWEEDDNPPERHKLSCKFYRKGT